MSDNEIVRPSVDQFRVCQIFGAIDEKTLAPLIPFARVCTFQPNQHIFRQANTANDFGWVWKGTVNVQVDVSFGEEITVMTLGRGMPFGWSAFVPPHQYHATVRAHDACEVILLKVPEAKHHFEEPTVRAVLMEGIATAISERLRNLRYQLVEIVGVEVGKAALRARG